MLSANLIMEIFTSQIVQGGLAAVEVTKVFGDVKGMLEMSKQDLFYEVTCCLDKALYRFCQEKGYEYDETAIKQTLELTSDTLQKMNQNEIQDYILKKGMGVENITDEEKKLWYYCIDKVIVEEPFMKLKNFIDLQFQRKNASSIPRIFTELAPLPPSKEYVEREAEEKEIANRIQSQKKLVLVNGLGGVGKSTVCKDLFYHLNKNHIVPLAWIDYNGQDLFHDFVEQFKYPSRRKERRERLKYFLQNEIDESAIIFIDNFNAREIDDSFIVELAKSKCNIVCTSRITEFEYFTTVPVSLFDMDRCIELFKKYANMNEDCKEYDEAIKEIIMRVGKHTLTIEILGKISYAEEKSPSRLLEELEEKGIDLSGVVEMQLKEDTLVGHLCKIFPTNQLNKNQKYILFHLALCPFEQIPKAIRTWIGIENQGMHHLRYLKRYGWFVENDKSYYMHPIIKEVVKKVCAFTLQDGYDVLLNHLIDLTKYKRGKSVTERKPFHMYSLRILEELKGVMNAQIAQLYFNLAIIEQETKDYQSSIDKLKLALKVWSSEEIRKNHSSIYLNNKIANIQVQIGASYYYIDEKEEAKYWYNQTLEMYGKYKDAELTAQLYNNFALIYQKEAKNQGITCAEVKRKRTKAIIYFKKTIEEFLKMKKRDMFLALAYRNTASCYMDFEKYEEAWFYFNKALELFQMTTDPDNPNLERSYYCLAQVFEKMGDSSSSKCSETVKYKIALLYYGRSHVICNKNRKHNASWIDLDELEDKIEICNNKYKNIFNKVSSIGSL